MRISVNIPSYKRTTIKTLSFAPMAKVWVDESEYDDYKKENPQANIVSVKKGIQGNVARIRNHILDTEFANGYDAVCLLDDDIREMTHFYTSDSSAYGYEKYVIGEHQFIQWLEENTMVCIEWGYKLWGVNLSDDKRVYHHTTPFNTTQVILGPFGVHLPNKIRYDEKLPLKEDYDLALQHLAKYHGILRFNGYNYICEQSTNRGGCANMRNQKKEKEQFDLLRKKWGSQIVRSDKSSKKGFDYNPIIRVPIGGI